MENLDDFKLTVSKNLIYYRKKAELTQAELAEKLNYSDKAVSKWERGETLPDTYLLKNLADIYAISVDDFFHENLDKTKKMPFSIKQAFKNTHFLITLLSCGLVYLLACIAFVCLGLLNIDFPAYLIFIYTVPVCSIICIIFSSLWAKKWVSGIFASLLIWSTFVSVFLSFKLDNFWLIFLIAIPLQVLVILWFFLMKEKFKIQWHLKRSK